MCGIDRIIKMMDYKGQMVVCMTIVFENHSHLY